MNINENNARIYIACISAYNNGFLHGRWIDAYQGIDHIQENIKEILESSPVAEECDEWGIHDSDGFGNYIVSESHDLSDLCDVAELINDCQDFPPKLVTSLIQDYGIDEAKSKMDDDFIGEFDSVTDLAYQHIDDSGLLHNVDKTITMYFDYKAFGNDLVLNGEVLEFDGFYFWNN